MVCLLGGLVLAALVDLLVSLTLLAFLALVLLNQANFVLVKVSEDVRIIQEILVTSLLLRWLCTFFIDGHFVQLIRYSINLIEVFPCSLFDIIKSIKSIHVMNHVFRKLLLFLEVAFHKKSER